MAERSLWRQLDLSDGSGVTCANTELVLYAAAARAGGQLDTLRLPSHFDLTSFVLFSVLRANAATLRALHVDDNRESRTRSFLSADRCEMLLGAAPLLQTFMAGVTCSSVDARRLLRNEPPFGPLRMSSMHVRMVEGASDADVLATAADLTAHASLEALEFGGSWRFPGAAAADAVVDAALSLRLSGLDLYFCGLSPAWAPSLTRLLSSVALKYLQLNGSGQTLLDAPSAALLAPALRASSLTRFELFSSYFFREAASAAMLLDALTAHPCLRVLLVSEGRIDDDFTGHEAVVGPKLGSLLAADSALEELVVCNCALGDAGLGPLVAALPRNTRLHVLDICENNMTDAFARDVLLPAVRANSSLRELTVADGQDSEGLPNIGHEAVRCACEQPQRRRSTLLARSCNTIDDELTTTYQEVRFIQRALALKAQSAFAFAPPSRVSLRARRATRPAP